MRARRRCISSSARLPRLHGGGIVVADALHAAIQRFLRRIQDLHGIAEIGEGHGDAAAHRAGTDHGRVAEIAYRRIGGDVGQLGHFALDEERVAQCARLVRILQFLEQIASRRQPSSNGNAVAASTAAMQ